MGSRSRSISFSGYLWQGFFVLLLGLSGVSAEAQSPIPPLPDSAGWGVHVLSVARDPRGTIWVGTYGHGIYRLPAGATAWEPIRHDPTETSISWDFVQALAFGARGQIWYGTLGKLLQLRSALAVKDDAQRRDRQSSETASKTLPQS